MELTAWTGDSPRSTLDGIGGGAPDGGGLLPGIGGGTPLEAMDELTVWQVV